MAAVPDPVLLKGECDMLWNIFFGIFFVLGCSGAESGDDAEADTDGGTESADELPDAETDGDWYQPAAGTTWQWQLSGDINAAYDVEVYDIDLFNSTAADIAALKAQGRRVICYFSAGSYEDFRDDAGEFPEEVLGNPLDDFPDERWLDIRAAEVLEIMLARLDTAFDRGCDGVEPDNVDGFSNDSGFDLAAADQLLFNAQIANAAHDRDLSVGLKNDLDQIESLMEYFDFAVNEQCYEFDECDLLEPFLAADKAVFNAEYDDSYVDDESSRSEICAASHSSGMSTLVLPVDLDDSFRLSCD